MSLVIPAEVVAMGADGGLDTATLQSVIDREEAELTRRFGSPTASRSETFDGGDVAIYTLRPISSVTSITEADALGETATTLTAADYHARLLIGEIRRLPEGAVWGREVVVTYTPVDDTNLRKVVLIELVRLAAEQDTGASVSGLGYSISGGPKDTAAWTAVRNALYARLGFSIVA